MYSKLLKSWQESPAHLLLLSKFCNGDSPERYNKADYWEVALKGEPTKAIQQFINDGMLEPADLHELINYKFKVSELVLLLKEQRLKITGRKDALIQRLIENDLNKMRAVTKGLNLYRCTEKGKQLAENYLNEEKTKREIVMHKVTNLLENKEYSSAASIVAQYEAKQVFSRGLGIDWRNYDIASDVESLKTIFEATPKILEGMDENHLKPLRFAAGMMHLWGTNNSKEWLQNTLETGIHLDSDATCRMLLFYAIHLRNMKNFREAGIKTIEILGVNDENTCSECQKISGKKYQLEYLPELPYCKCTCAMGCRCTTVMSDFK
ncbi:MAG TPA: hypothetical protein VI749_06040 [Candidatus Omnitrophota bacterium]|nr:hypothetical protein [Candidatus Omnitrophota bacterium]